MSKPIQVNQNNLDNKATVFHLNLEKISFMYEGMFMLKLTVNNSFLSDKSGVRLRTKNSNKFLKDFSVRTEVISSSKREAFSNFVMDEYTFYLPKGFCKNDMDHDVHLLIEALQVMSDAKTQIIGTVKLPIYPRPDVMANYNVERGEPFYNVRGSIRLLRPNIRETNLHCGDLFYKSEFSEILEIYEPEEAPQPKSKPPAESIELRTVTPPPPPPPPPPRPSSPPPNKASPKRMIEVSSSPHETPKPVIGKPNKGNIINFGVSPPTSPNPPRESLPKPSHMQSLKRTYDLLSPRDKEELSIFVRGGENIANHNQSPTQSYVACTLKTDETIVDATHVTTNITSTPLWEEILNLAFPPDKIDRVLSIKVIDNVANQLITEFLLPIKNLDPFFHHHLKLCQSFPSDNVNPTLFVTIVRKLDHYPLSGKDYTFSALIIKPLLLFHQITDRHSLACFAYLSNDRTQKISKNIQSIDENFVEVNSPVPSNHSYRTKNKYPMWSWGQLSIPSSLQQTSDTWNFPFLFCQKPEIDTAFSADSFIVLDFYSVPRVSSNGMNWRNHPPVAQSIVKLDKLLYRQLQEKEKCVINSYDFEINGKFLSLWTVSGTEENHSNVEKENKIRIKIVLTKENISDGIYPDVDVPFPVKKPIETKLPILQKVRKPKKTNEPFLYEIKPLGSGQSVDYVFNKPDKHLHGEYGRVVFPKDTNEQKPKPNKEGLYKNSLRKMQIELLNLRERCQQMATENESLEQKVSIKSINRVSQHGDTLRELESLHVSDLHDRYDKLRRKFGTQMSLLSDLQEKEKNLRLRETSAKLPKDSGDVYKKLKATNEYIKTLERRAFEKEAVILRLESVLDDKDIMEEHVAGYDTSHNIPEGNEERNHLYDLIERSENRIKKLQNELIDLSRKRGARKQMLRIREQEKLSNYDNML